MDLKSILITGAVTTILGTAGYMNAGSIKEAVQCVGQDVHLEYQDAYYCGSVEEFADTYDSLEDRLVTNKLLGDDERGLVFGILVAHNNVQLHYNLKQIFIEKYDSKTDEFDGMKFDNDLFNQFSLLMEVASAECDGECELVGDTMNQRIYNLIK